MQAVARMASGAADEAKKKAPAKSGRLEFRWVWRPTGGSVSVQVVWLRQCGAGRSAPPQESNLEWIASCRMRTGSAWRWACLKLPSGCRGWTSRRGRRPTPTRNRSILRQSRIMVITLRASLIAGLLRFGPARSGGTVAYRRSLNTLVSTSGQLVLILLRTMAELDHNIRKRYE